jgi:polysaccharide pyruvyl transferase WcaK-like protein
MREMAAQHESCAGRVLTFPVTTADHAPLRHVERRAGVAMPVTRVGLLHHVGGGNLGDDATLESVAGNIRHRWPGAEIIALSMNPDDTEARHGIRSYPVRRTRWSAGYQPTSGEATFKARVKAFMRKCGPVFLLLRAIGAALRATSGVLGELSFLLSSHRRIKSFDLLIVSGGGQLTEKDGPWGFPYTIWKWLMLAKWAGVRSIVLNVGAGPLSRPLSRYFARRALLMSDYVSLRDEKSQALLHRIGFNGDSSVFPDSVYGLEVEASIAIRSQRPARRVVGFAPMPYPDPRMYIDERDQIIYDAFIEQLAGFASWLTEQSYSLSFFGTDIGVDPLAIADLVRTLLDRHDMDASHYRVAPNVTSVRSVLATMSEADFVVTCRFHGVIFANLLTKPVLAIAHHPKVSELMAELGLSDYCVDIRDFDLKLLADRFAAMVADSEQIKSRMAASLTRNRQLLTEQFDELFRCEVAQAAAASGPQLAPAARSEG